MRTSITCLPVDSHLTSTASPPVRIGNSRAVPTACAVHTVPVAVQEQILAHFLDIADQANSDEREVAYVAFIRLVHCWPDCRNTSFRLTARMRLVSKLLHETDTHLRDLIHDALQTLKNSE